MCVVSMVTDHYTTKWTPLIDPNPYLPAYPNIIPNIPAQAELDEFRELLRKAREYDKRNNEPNCELQEKKDRLKAVADALGLNISFIDEE